MDINEWHDHIGYPYAEQGRRYRRYRLMRILIVWCGASDVFEPFPFFTDLNAAILRRGTARNRAQNGSGVLWPTSI